VLFFFITKRSVLLALEKVTMEKEKKRLSKQKWFKRKGKLGIGT